MNILFLNPPFKRGFSRTSRSPGVARGGTLYFPIWLAYATGVAEAAGHDVRLVDAPAAGLDLNGCFERLNGFSVELIVVDTSTPSIYNDVSVAAMVKNRYRDSFLLMVGTHPSALPEQTLGLNPAVDGIAVGEYDYTVRDLATAIQRGSSIENVGGLVLRQNGGFIRTAERKKIEDLDSLPFVSSVYKKHLNFKSYRFAAANYPYLMILTTRGCPFNCFFCVYPQVFHAKKYRKRSPENVVDEFEYIINNFQGVKEIGLEDDCFTANRKHVRRICELLIERAIKVNWYCNVRGDLDYETIKLMKRAGCRLVTVGFESGSQKVLDQINKGETIGKYLEFSKSARKAGMLIHGCIMVGNPGDSPQTLHQGYEMAKNLNCDSMQFYPLYVYPGTDAYDWADKNGYLKTKDFSKWLTPEGFHNCVHDIPGLSSSEMVKLCNMYLRNYHLRPAYLFMKIAQALRYPSEGLRSIKSGLNFLGNLWSGLSRKNPC